ncbi:MAG: exodeoxyribonuclease VII large subunit, partial [Thiomicrorhabdus sp.]|nr:exodeoxyribonuclease VII large subunit [Thiomicrorhabdus sp.]
IWQRQATALLQRFETETGSPLAIGQKVLLLVEVSFHEQYGSSIVIQDIDSSYTLGALERNLSELRKQLILEKSYDKNKRFTLPSDFFRIAIIAPPDAAGLGDFRADADALQSQSLCEFHYFYSAFQGDAVQKEMQVAFEAVEALHQSKPFDALVIIRGGGAKLDLHMLNSYALAKLLCDATLPVITGIGHERDNTILDEVANQHFDTPSKVIAHIRHEIFQQAQQAQANWKKIEHTSLLCVKQLEQTLEHLNQRIQHQSQQALFGWKQRIEPLNSEVRRLSESQIQTKQHHLNDLMASIEMQSNNRIALKKQVLEQQYCKVKEGGERALLQRKQQIQQWIAHILSSGPKTQLNRGFNLAKDPSNNKPVTSAKEALAVKYLQLEFIDGVVSAHIEKEINVTRKES